MSIHEQILKGIIKQNQISKKKLKKQKTKSNRVHSLKQWCS